MLPDPIVAPYDGNGAITSNSFKLITMNGSSSVRVVGGAANEVPNTMKISHTTVGKGALMRDRRLLRLENHGITDGVRDTTIVGSLSLVSDLPRNVAFTANCKEMLIRQFIGLLRGNTAYNAPSVPVLTFFWNRFLDGEV